MGRAWAQRERALDHHTLPRQREVVFAYLKSSRRIRSMRGYEAWQLAIRRDTVTCSHMMWKRKSRDIMYAIVDLGI